MDQYDARSLHTLVWALLYLEWSSVSARAIHSYVQHQTAAQTQMMRFATQPDPISRH